MFGVNWSENLLQFSDISEVNWKKRIRSWFRISGSRMNKLGLELDLIGAIDPR